MEIIETCTGPHLTENHGSHAERQGRGRGELLLSAAEQMRRGGTPCEGISGLGCSSRAPAAPGIWNLRSQGTPHSPPLSVRESFHLSACPGQLLSWFPIVASSGTRVAIGST